MGVIGNLLGGALGSLGGALLPIPGVNGKEIGGWLGGNILPFKRGGRVLPPRTKSGRFRKRKSRK